MEEEPRSAAKRTPVRSALLQGVHKEISKTGQREDLVVDENETRVLSSASRWCRSYYVEIQPKDIDEIKEILGVPNSIALPALSRTTAVVSADSKRIRARTMSPKALSDGKLPDSERTNNLMMARTATREYIYGNSQEVFHWKATIDEYLKAKSPRLFVPFFNDIVVHNGGTLQVLTNTHAVYARKIQLYGSGKIECEGPTTFDCDSFEGSLLPKLSLQVPLSVQP